MISKEIVCCGFKLVFYGINVGIDHFNLENYSWSGAFLILIMKREIVVGGVIECCRYYILNNIFQAMPLFLHRYLETEQIRTLIIQFLFLCANFCCNLANILVMFLMHAI